MFESMRGNSVGTARYRRRDSAHLAHGDRPATFLLPRRTLAFDCLQHEHPQATVELKNIPSVNGQIHLCVVPAVRWK